jgi:hypothetical protein
MIRKEKTTPPNGISKKKHSCTFKRSATDDNKTK